MIKKKKKTETPKDNDGSLLHQYDYKESEWHIYPLLRGQTFAMDVSY